MNNLLSLHRKSQGKNKKKWGKNEEVPTAVVPLLSYCCPIDVPLLSHFKWEYNR